MYAQLQALCCLAAVTVFPVLAQGARVEVLLHDTNDTPARILGEMKSELSGLMGRAGFQIDWHGAHDFAGDLVMVAIRGSCEPPSAAIHDSRIVQMGSSAVADGKVLPFSWVDCTAIAQLLEPYLAHMPKDQRDLTYGRAMARVLAHEFYHVLRRTRIHTASGLTKARLEPADLLSETAEYGKVALAKPADPVRLSLFVRAAAHP